MDPLSVIGSVVGILAVTSKLTGSLVDFIRREVEAPASMHGIVAELSALRGCLSQLQPFMQGSKQAALSEARRRESLPVSQANKNLVLGYNIVTQLYIPVNYPQIKLVLAGMFTSIHHPVECNKFTLKRSSSLVGR